MNGTPRAVVVGISDAGGVGAGVYPVPAIGSVAVIGGCAIGSVATSVG